MRISDWSSDVCSSDLPLLCLAKPRNDSRRAHECDAAACPVPFPPAEEGERCGEYRVFAQDLHQRRAFAAADHLQKAKTIDGSALEWLGQVFIKEIGRDLPLILVVHGRQVNARIGRAHV